MRNTIGSPVWQCNYYDRIIRNDKELDKIREYIHPVRTIHLIVSIN
jgi:hypothetical protein